MLTVILAEAAAPRCRVVARRRWEVGARGWGGDGERGLQGISATSWIKSPHTPVAAGDSDPFSLHPLGEAAQRECIKGGAAGTDQRLLGAPPANQCLQRAPKGLLVAFGPVRTLSMSKSAQAMTGVAIACG
jgi:hypothetical protein